MQRGYSGLGLYDQETCSAFERQLQEMLFEPSWTCMGLTPSSVRMQPWSPKELLS